MMEIIGGAFGLGKPGAVGASAPDFLKPDSLLFVNARSGARWLVEWLKPQRIWLPSYLCASLQEACAVEPELLFYNVRDQLWDLPDELFESREGDLVVVIDYFGIRQSDIAFTHLQNTGAWILEDASQALLSEGVGRGADFVLHSPRKHIGVADGGILSPGDACMSWPEKVELAEVPDKWWRVAREAASLRGEFDRSGRMENWFPLFQEAESSSPVGPYRMSELSRQLIETAFDYPAISRRRKANYEALARGLRRFAMMPDLPAGSVPLGFPVRLRNREEVREALQDERIYSPVHWALQGVVPESFRSSHILSQELLTLPCDQRYGREEMERIVAVVLDTCRRS